MKMYNESKGKLLKRALSVLLAVAFLITGLNVVIPFTAGAVDAGSATWNTDITSVDDKLVEENEAGYDYIAAQANSTYGISMSGTMNGGVSGSNVYDADCRITGTDKNGTGSSAYYTFASGGGFWSQISLNDYLTASFSTSFFPTGFYVKYGGADAGKSYYDMSFYIENYLNGSDIDYFSGYTVSTNNSNFTGTYTATDKIAAEYMEKYGNLYSGNTRSLTVSGNTSGKLDLRPFLYKYINTLNSDIYAPATGTDTYSNWFKGIDQFGVNYTAITYSIANAPDGVTIDDSTGTISVASTVVGDTNAEITVTCASSNGLGDTVITVPVTIKGAYNLTVNANGGKLTNGSGTANYTYWSDSTYGTKLETPVYTGYTFLGWYDAQTGGNEVKSTDIIATPGHSVYAHWQTYTLATPSSTISNNSVSYGYTDSPVLTCDASTLPTTDTTLSYQWYLNGIVVSGATSASYTVPTGQTAGTYTYKCLVKATDKSDSNTDSKYSNEVSLTVSKRTLTVTPESGQGSLYGTADGSALTYVVSGNVTGHEAVLTGALTRDAGTEIGTYGIKQGTLALSDDSINSNYTLVFTSGINYTISALELSSDINATVSGTIGKNGWYITSAQITAPDGYLISATQTGTSETWTSYITVTDGDYSSGTSYYLKRISDGAISSAKTVSLKQDTSAATGKITIGTRFWTDLLNNITFGKFFKDTQSVEITASDSTSGVSNISYYLSTSQLSEAQLKSLNSSAWTTYTDAFNINPDNEYIIYAKFTDNAGNDKYISTEGLVLDATAPIINSTYSYNNQWTDDTTASVSGTVTEKLSGIASFTYKAGANNPVEITTSGSNNAFSISLASLPDGDYDLVLSATDNSGNTSSTVTYRVKKDTELPTITVSDAATGYVTSQTAVLTVTNNVCSGIASVQYRTSSGSWTNLTENDGSYSLTVNKNGIYYFRAISNSGVISETVSKTYTNIDTLVPAIKVSAADSNGNAYTENTWTNKTVTLTLSNTTSNLGDTTYEYKLGDGEWTEFDGSISPAVTGTYAYSFRVTSAAGKVSSTVNYTVKIDKTDPSGTITSGTNNFSQFMNNITFGHFYKDTVDVSFTSSDADSGVKSIVYYKSSQALTSEQISAVTTWTTAETFSVSPDEKFVVYAKITDNAGNIAYISTEGDITDKTIPTLSAVPSFTTTGGVWDTSSTAEVVIAATDELSGINNVKYQITDGKTEPYTYVVEQTKTTGSFSIPNSELPDGDYYIFITATDNSGNSVKKTIEVKRDTTGIIIAAEPSNLDITYGESAQFDVNVTSTSAISYQWQKYDTENSSWVNISGATSSTYTISQPSVADSLSEYRVHVSNEAGFSADTDEAILTVSKASLTVTPDTVNVSYGAAEQTLTYTYTGQKFTDVPVFTGSLSRESGNYVGTYEISKGTLALSNAAVNNNYNLKINPANYNITAYNP